MLRSLLAAVVLMGGTANAGELPRYKLRAGEVLRYAAESDTQRDALPAKTERADWTLWVAGDRPAGGWDVVATRAVRVEFDPKGGRVAPIARAELFRFGLTPDGTLTLAEDQSSYASYYLRAVLPKLPASPAQVTGGYEEAWERSAMLDRYRASRRADGTWEVVATDAGFATEIYDITASRTFAFDPELGRPVGATSSNKQGAVVKGVTTGRLRVQTGEAKGLPSAADMAADAGRYFGIRATVDAAWGDEATVDTFRKAADAARKARDACVSDTVRATLDDEAKRFERMAAQPAEASKPLIGRKVEWKTADLDGTPVALSDFKGKVVVLDFWYRGCFWCVRAMPQMNELTEHYKGKPVVVLGLNRDRDLADARFVMAKMKLVYPTLKMEELHRDYGVSSYPTVLILDGEGVVRAMHSGYDKKLKAMLVEKIDRVLAP